MKNNNRERRHRSKNATKEPKVLYADIGPTPSFSIREDGDIRVDSRGDARRAPRLAFRNQKGGVWIYQGNCLQLLDAIHERYPEGRFDCIFADPPYFLSNGGITCHNGQMVRVDKGHWDKSRGPELNHEFNREWLRRCQQVLRPNGTIWISGTHHVIFSIGYALQQLGFKILNDVVWEKPNPPPNLSCRYFTHSTETLLWAAKNERSRHAFNYADMKALNGGTQMKTVWKIPASGRQEKLKGKHPTQKPVELVRRCLLAATKPGDLVLDPFLGSGTTAVAATTIGRQVVGIEQQTDYVELARRRLIDISEEGGGEPQDAGEQADLLATA